jgi:hypothetical protein
MENNFYKKIYIITLCNFWYRSYSWHNTQHIQKLDTEGLWILRYSRSRVSTFLFFMQKLSGTGLGKNNKSCRIFHNEPKNIGFSFFMISPWFSAEFTRISKSHLLFKTRFSLQVPGIPVSIAIRSLVHEKHPGKNEGDAM